MVLTLFSLQKRIVGLTIIFLLIGQLMLFSATGVMGLQQHGTEFYYMLRQGLCGFLGLILMFGLSRVRYQVWRKFAYLIIAIQCVLLIATGIAHFGHYVKGASRWLRLGPLQFQPSELVKISLTIYVSRLLAQFENIKPPTKVWVIHGAIVAFTLFLVLRQPDFGSTLLLSVEILALFFLAGVRLTYILGVLGSGTGLAMFAMLHTDYRRRRLFAFLNPWADPQGSGFQTIQSFLSFHSGKLFGVGIGNGNSKLFFLPEVHTDFIFALIGEELGFVGAVGVILLFVYFGYLLLKASFRSPDAFGRYLGCGLSISLFLQIAVNLGGVTGFLPIKGLPLPFISWGRSALIVNLAMVGILLNIVRQSGIIETTKSSKG